MQNEKAQIIICLVVVYTSGWFALFGWQTPSNYNIFSFVFLNSNPNPLLL